MWMIRVIGSTDTGYTGQRILRQSSETIVVGTKQFCEIPDAPHSVTLNFK